MSIFSRACGGLIEFCKVNLSRRRTKKIEVFGVSKGKISKSSPQAREKMFFCVFKGKSGQMRRRRAKKSRFLVFSKGKSAKVRRRRAKNLRVLGVFKGESAKI